MRFIFGYLIGALFAAAAAFTIFGVGAEPAAPVDCKENCKEATH